LGEGLYLILKILLPELVIKPWAFIHPAFCKEFYHAFQNFRRLVCTYAARQIRVGGYCKDCTKETQTEPEEAQMNVELSKGKLIVRHTDVDGPVLHDELATQGQWNRIWEAIRGKDQLKDFMQKIDFKLLKEQKRYFLYHLADDSVESEGILGLIDYIQDTAVDVCGMDKNEILTSSEE